MANFQVLLEKVKRLAGLDTTRQAAAALRATLAVLGQRLPQPERDAFGRALPERARVWLQARRFRGEFDVPELFDRVRRAEGVTLGFAREHAEVVCRVCGAVLPDELRQRLERELPPSWSELFFPPAVPEAEGAPPGRPSPGNLRRTLATGRPGGSHPMSESRPPSDVQSESVASADPHESSKLSTARGTTQERLGETLASAHPGAERPLSDG